MAPYSLFKISCSDLFDSYVSFHVPALLRYLLCRGLRPDSLEGFVHSKDRGMAAPTQESATDGIPTTPLGPASHGSGGASSQPVSSFCSSSIPCLMIL